MGVVGSEVVDVDGPWRSAAFRALEAAAELRPLRDRIWSVLVDSGGFKAAHSLWTDRLGSAVLVDLTPGWKSEDAKALTSGLAKLGVELRLEQPDRVPEPRESEGWIKVAYSPLVRSLATHFGLAEGNLFGAIPVQPGPVTSFLSGGLLGAGLGYGGGWLAEKLLPAWAARNRRDRFSFRNRMALLGVLAGASPGVVVMAGNWAAGRPLLSGEHLKGLPEEIRPFNKRSSALDDDLPVLVEEGVACCAAELFDGVEARRGPESAKSASSYGMAGFSEALPPVDLNAFGSVLWGDPRIKSLSQKDRSLLSSVVYGGAQMPAFEGKTGPGWVPRVATPGNMAKVMAGYGLGRISAGLGSAALSVLFNLPESTQERMKDVGSFAGALSQVADLLR